MDCEKAVAELPILQDFINFINKQVGVFCDCITSFNGNKVRVERQIHRYLRPTSKTYKNGQPTIMWSSYEDPKQPDILHHRTIRVDDFLQDNSENGFNEKQISWAIIVFIFSHWDEIIRPQIAKIRKVSVNEVKVPEFGDLRIIRNAIIHNQGFLSSVDFEKITTMKDLLEQNQEIRFSHEKMHQFFIKLKQGIARLGLEYTGELPGAPNLEDISGIAIQMNSRFK